MVFNQLLLLAAAALSVHAANYKRVACPDGKNTANNAACCVFFSLRDDLLTNLFDEGCGEEVHETVRHAFHDAISFSPSKGGGGADGSMLLFPNVEPNFANNNGISGNVDDLTPFLSRHNVTAGDLVQFAAAVGLTQCPGAPRITFKSGRPNAKAPAPDGLVPAPDQSVATIVARFADAGGFSSAEVVALLASHSIARADHVDATIQAAPFDSTPFTFDSQFFVEVQLRGTGFPGTGSHEGEVMSALSQHGGDDVGEMRLESDHNFARDSSTACVFQSFVNNQNLMMTKFAAAFEKLSTVGVKAALTDCSEAVPAAPPPVTKKATFPAGKSNKDIEQACASTPFPTLATDPGPATLIPHCPNGLTSCDEPDTKRRKRALA